MARILVVGGGAAGMMASAVAAEQGHKVVLFEQNEKLGKKIYITGKRQKTTVQTDKCRQYGRTV